MFCCWSVTQPQGERSNIQSNDVKLNVKRN